MVAQWRHVAVFMPFARTTYSLNLQSSAWIIGKDIPAVGAFTWNVSDVTPENAAWVGDDPWYSTYEEESIFEDLMDGPDGTMISVFGTFFEGRFWRIPHWLCVSVLLLVNVVLYFFLRRRRAARVIETKVSDSTKTLASP